MRKAQKTRNELAKAGGEVRSGAGRGEAKQEEWQNAEVEDAADKGGASSQATSILTSSLAELGEQAEDAGELIKEAEVKKWATYHYKKKYIALYEKCLFLQNSKGSSI